MSILDGFVGPSSFIFNIFSKISTDLSSLIENEEIYMQHNNFIFFIS